MEEVGDRNEEIYRRDDAALDGYLYPAANRLDNGHSLMVTS